MEWLRLVGSLSYRSLLQKIPIKETRNDIPSKKHAITPIHTQKQTQKWRTNWWTNKKITIAPIPIRNQTYNHVNNPNKLTSNPPKTKSHQNTNPKQTYDHTSTQILWQLGLHTFPQRYICQIWGGFVMFLGNIFLQKHKERCYTCTTRVMYTSLYTERHRLCCGCITFLMSTYWYMA